jgi:benzoyl-CoA reductase subunit C
MGTVRAFREVYENRHLYAKEWKEKNPGGKVVGYFCTYVPEEILYATDILPVRILGGHEPPTLVTPYMIDMWCPFSRDCFNQGLQGRYDYLDGIMIAQSCLHARQAFSSWEINIPAPWKYYLCMPQAVRSPAAKTFLRGELERFKEAVEGWAGKKITDQDLDRGIEIMNTNRQLLKEVYEFRKLDAPALTGTEVMTMVWASLLMDKSEHNGLVRELLEILPDRKPNRETGARLMMIGSENDDRAFLEMVEQNLKATLVIEDHCTGSRYFWDEVIPKEDRLQAISDRYCDRIPCPSKDYGMGEWQRKRFSHILKLAQDYRVQGAILMHQKFCDPHEMDTPSLRRYLESNGIPTCFLEFDVSVPVGQFRVRVEAFIEQLQGDELFS